MIPQFKIVSVIDKDRLKCRKCGSFKIMVIKGEFGVCKWCWNKDWIERFAEYYENCSVIEPEYEPK